MSAGSIARRTGLAAAAAGAAAAAVLLRRRSGAAPEGTAPRASAPRAPSSRETPSPASSSQASSQVPSSGAPASASDGHITGPLHMNETSFEDLRALGLSITQAKRFLEVRTELDGFGSVDELDDVPGLPRDLRERLREQLRA